MTLELWRTGPGVGPEISEARAQSLGTCNQVLVHTWPNAVMVKLQWRAWVNADASFRGTDCGACDRKWARSPGSRALPQTPPAFSSDPTRQRPGRRRVKLYESVFQKPHSGDDGILQRTAG